LVDAERADLRRTTVTRGEATLLSSHAGDPRTAAGDTSFAGQAWQSRRNRHESARRQPEDLPLRSDVTARASTLTVTIVLVVLVDRVGELRRDRDRHIDAPSVRRH